MRQPAFVVECVTLLLGCTDRDDHEHSAMKTGKQLYAHHCAACHRGDGQGDFPKGVPPVKYTPLTLVQMVDKVRGHGRPDDSRMPAFPNIPKGKAGAIAVYIRSHRHPKQQ